MSPRVIYGISDVTHGPMSAVDPQSALANRRNFLSAYDITPEQTILVRLKYEGDDYRRYYEVSSEHAGDGVAFGSSIISDALFTRSKHVALLLPVADCVAAVLYDPTTELLGLAHLGRHNLIQSGMTSVIEYAVSLGAEVANLQVWLGPAAGRQSYPLYDFNNRSLHEVTLEQLYAAGIRPDAVTVDERDTTTDDSLYSHSEFLAGRQSIDGRQAVVAMMRP